MRRMMNKTTLLIIFISFISLVIGVFAGYRMNPINKEVMSDLDNISKKLGKISNIINTDTNVLMTQSFVSILLDLSTKIKNGKIEAALAIIESTLIDIRSQIVNNLGEELNDDEKLLLEHINNQIVNNKKFEGK